MFLILNMSLKKHIESCIKEAANTNAENRIPNKSLGNVNACVQHGLQFIISHCLRLLKERKRSKTSLLGGFEAIFEDRKK